MCSIRERAYSFVALCLGISYTVNMTARNGKECELESSVLELCNSIREPSNSFKDKFNYRAHQLN